MKPFTASSLSLLLLAVCPTAYLWASEPVATPSANAPSPHSSADWNPSDPLRITQWQIVGDELQLSWTNRPSRFRVQRMRWNESRWSDVITSTRSFSIRVPLESPGALFRVLEDDTAQYQVEFQATWSRQTHPQDWPNPGHWSGLVGGVHNEQVHFWREGETASEGIRMMAELGSQPRLLSEVTAAIQLGTADFTLAGGGINPSPGSVRLTFPQRMRREFPLVTLCSMIAPSPDWFAGVDSLSLLENGEWVSEKVVEIFGMDAGTDSGVTFRSPDSVTVPRGVVTRFTGFPALVDGQIVPFGYFKFTRMD